jgi:hypothetical protein
MLFFKVPIFEYSTTLPELSRQSVVALEEVCKIKFKKIFF